MGKSPIAHSVLVLDHVRCIRAGRHKDQEVALTRAARRRLGSNNGQGRINPAQPDLADALTYAR